MDNRQIKLLRCVASESRHSVLMLVSEGVGHPDEIAQRTASTRQAVDKQLDILQAAGLVEKKAFTHSTGRPKVLFSVTEVGRKLIHDLEAALTRYLAAQEKEFKRAIEHLDLLLLKGELNEEIYQKKVEEMKERYRFLAGA
ncbi:MAG: hypothetical protein AB1665_03520 [Candidatus Thermoplasmatota archaeon]